MANSRDCSRQVFATRLSRGALALGVLGAAAACGSDDASDGSGGHGGVEQSLSGGAGVDWRRVNLGFVSAYLLLRDDEAAVVDTGVEGSAGDIEAVLTAADRSWQDVGHVIFTHRHADHVGSAQAVLTAAKRAQIYAGEADIPAIDAPRDITAVRDNDHVFGLQVVATPGHTAGHISLLDEAGGLLIAGDALNGGEGGKVLGANPEFTDDMTTADQSVRKLGRLVFNTLVFGHGEPVTKGASGKVVALAAEL